MVSWITEETTSNNMNYIYILLCVLVFMDVIACLHYISLNKGNKNKMSKSTSKSKAKTSEK